MSNESVIIGMVSFAYFEAENKKKGNDLLFKKV
jgi:hypothetical protein